MAKKKKRPFERLNSQLKGFNSRIRRLAGQLNNWVDKRPIVSFGIGLGLLLLTIVVGNYWRRPETVPKTGPTVKQVAVYNIGQAPTVTVQGRVEKSGVVPILAQTPGVVTQVLVEPGQRVERGSWLVKLATSYGGGNAPAVRRRLAQTQYNFARDNIELQRSRLAKQRELATTADTNSDELRTISEKSVSETRALLELNETILTRVSNDLDNLVATNSATGSNEDLILATRQLQSQYLRAVNSLKSSLRNLEYSTGANQPPARLGNLQRDAALEGLQLQEKSLELNLEVASLQLQLARINESLMYPAAPLAGVIERVWANAGQMVSPGTPLMVISGDEQSVTVIALVSERTVAGISRLEPSQIRFNDREISAWPTHIAGEPTDGQLYAVTYVLENNQIEVGNGNFVQVSIPLGYPDTSAAVPFVPVDTVHQTSEQAYVYLARDGVVVAEPVELGTVRGSYVEVRGGLKTNDQIILDRHVVVGDRVEAK